MCGICGVWNYGTRAPVDRDVLGRMTEAMHHRGPDDRGVHVDDAAGIGLGFRRLAIVDLTAAGRQPMANEDGTVWLVFNGAIYDFPALRDGLEARGHVFRSRTDTEVIVHAYEEHGPACVEHLNGMFGLALWDAPRRRLMLARDRIGKKPLYYYDDGRRLVFASELKALLCDPAVPRELNWPGVGEFLALGYTAGAQCITAGVRKLLPGHRLICANGRVVTERYWDWLPAFRRTDGARSAADWVAATREMLEACVRSRMTSDVPLGAFLSGGLDSSAVVAAMAAASPHPVKTFSIGFAEAAFDERPYASEVAAAFGTEHHELVLRPEGAAELLPRLVRQYDEPFADASAVPTYYLAKLARAHATVCLSGDGGDEACAGYDRYAQGVREMAADWIPSPLRRLLLRPLAALPIGVPGRQLARRLMLEPAQRYLDAMRQMPREQCDALLTPAAAQRIAGDGVGAIREAMEQAADLDPLSRMQYADGRVYLPDDILVKVDRASMLNGLEVRCPLLDFRFLALMAAAPAHLRSAGGRGKHLLREAMRGVLPDRVLSRPKMGFAVPLAAWFRGDLGAFARAVLLDRRTAARGIFRLPALEQLLRAQRSRERLSPYIWTALVFELWCRAYLDER